MVSGALKGVSWVFIGVSWDPRGVPGGFRTYHGRCRGITEGSGAFHEISGKFQGVKRASEALNGVLGVFHGVSEGFKSNPEV